jgi:hypothetical protein
MTTMQEPAVSPRRWIAAMVVGLVVWVVAMTALGPVLLNSPVNPLVGPFVAVVPGIVAAGLVVGARSARRWIAIGVLTAGLILAVSAALVYAFLQSGFMDG